MFAGDEMHLLDRGLARLPAAFISHGSPMVLLDDDAYTRTLARMGEELPKPRAIVVVSAHWEAPAPLRVGAAARPALIYDFAGFPGVLCRMDYAARGEPELAEVIAETLSAAGLEAVLEPRRGLDHGAWVPLRLAYPAADVPVVEVSLPARRAPEGLLRIGRALAPLRGREVLLLGSGGIVHNLGLVRFGDKDAPVDPWALAFDDWVRDRLAAGDRERLVGYRRSAPHADLAVRTSEHFDPLLVVLGATSDGEAVTVLHEGFQYGNLSMRSFLLGE